MRIFSPIVSDFYYPEDGLLDFWFVLLSRKGKKELGQEVKERKKRKQMFVSLSEIGISRVIFFRLYKCSNWKDRLQKNSEIQYLANVLGGKEGMQKINSNNNGKVVLPRVSGIW